MAYAKRQILVVDDDLDMLDIMSEVLAGESYTVHQAKNGKEALSFLLSCETPSLPDLIILDSIMPVMDGNAFLTTLRDEYVDRFAKIPIVLSSGNDHTHLEQFAPLKIRVLKKPMDITAFISTVDEHRAH